MRRKEIDSGTFGIRNTDYSGSRTQATFDGLSYISYVRKWNAYNDILTGDAMNDAVFEMRRMA